MIHTLIVDDEKNSRDVLLRLLARKFPEIQVVGEASSVEEAYTLIGESAPQLVFLDIQMPRASGFNLLKRFEEVPFEVIFVTSYDKYAITAIRFNALDYLLKPIEIEELEQAIRKAERNIEAKVNSNFRIVNLLHQLDDDVEDKKMAVHSGEKVKMLSIRSILFIEADRRYCRLSMANGEVYTTARILREYEDYLANDPAFVRISKSCIINTRHIREYSKGEPFMITMSNSTVFEVSRRKKPEVLERLKSE